jgi:hypothetical protein
VNESVDWQSAVICVAWRLTALPGSLPHSPTMNRRTAGRASVVGCRGASVGGERSRADCLAAVIQKEGFEIGAEWDGGGGESGWRSVLLMRERADRRHR